MKGHLAAAALPLLLLGLTVTVANGGDPGQPAYELDIQLVRDAKAGTYLCTAVVTDLATGAPIAAPRITGEMGKEATARTHHDQSEVVLTVTVDESSASYELIVSDSGAVIARQRASVKG
jgi:hypothetical protein